MINCFNNDSRSEVGGEEAPEKTLKVTPKETSTIYLLNAKLSNGRVSMLLLSLLAKRRDKRGRGIRKRSKHFSFFYPDRCIFDAIMNAATEKRQQRTRMDTEMDEYTPGLTIFNVAR